MKPNRNTADAQAHPYLEGEQAALGDPKQVPDIPMNLDILWECGPRDILRSVTSLGRPYSGGGEARGEGAENFLSVDSSKFHSGNCQPPLGLFLNLAKGRLPSDLSEFGSHFPPGGQEGQEVIEKASCWVMGCMGC